MKSGSFLGFMVVLGTLVATPVMSADYVIDKKGQHASVNFRANHLGFSYIAGRFNEFEGEFSHDPANPKNSKVNVTINARSVDTNHAERDKHLRSEDFFEVDKYPLITFVSTSYEAGSSVDKLTGNLTVHGVTRPVAIDVKHVGEGKDPWGGYRSGFRGDTMVKAADFGLPDWVGDISIELNVEGVRK